MAEKLDEYENLLRRLKEPEIGTEDQLMLERQDKLADELGTRGLQRLLDQSRILGKDLTRDRVEKVETERTPEGEVVPKGREIVPTFDPQKEVFDRKAEERAAQVAARDSKRAPASKLIEEVEGFSPNPYNDANKKAITKKELSSWNDRDGFPTVGFGHLLTPEERSSGTIKVGDKKISIYEMSEDDARLIKANDIKKTSRSLGDYSSASAGQKTALESMAINYPKGAKKFKARIDSGKTDDAINNWLASNKTNGKYSEGLLRRRVKELKRYFIGEKGIKEYTEKDLKFLEDLKDRAESEHKKHSKKKYRFGSEVSRGPSSVSEDVDTKKQKTALETLMDEYLKTRSEGDKEIASARKKDMILSLADTIDKAFSRFDAATASEAAGRAMKPVGLDSAPLQSLEKLARSKNKEKRTELISAYKAFTEGKLTPYQQASLGQRQKELAERQKGEKRREKTAKRQQTKLQIDTARGFLKDDPRFKKAVEQGMEFETVDQLVKAAEGGNQAALASLGTKLARAMGEVGVLTDTDVVRYVGGTSWGRKLKDWADKGFEGQLSPETTKDIKDNLKILKKKLTGDVTRVYSNASNRMKTAFPDMEDKTIRGLLGTPILSDGGKTVSKKMYSPSRDKTKIIYSDGSEEIVDGKK